MIIQSVLTADSDPYVQAFVQRTLANVRLRVPALRDVVRFTTEFVSTDDEAIRRLAVAPPDILVTEHWGRRLSGIKILKAMRNLHPATVAVVAASCPRIPAAVEATKLGAFEFLAKPLTKQRFLEVVVEATAARMGCVVEPESSSKNDIQNAVPTWSRIPAALANFATTAASLYW